MDLDPILEMKQSFTNRVRSTIKERVKGFAFVKIEHDIVLVTIKADNIFGSFIYPNWYDSTVLMDNFAEHVANDAVDGFRKIVMQHFFPSKKEDDIYDS